MQTQELIKIIKINYYTLKKAMEKAAEKYPTILVKKDSYKADFSKEEALEIAKNCGANNLKLIYIEENCKDALMPDGYKKSGTNEFLEKWKENHKIKCCNTCISLIGKKTSNSSIPIPYCTLYGRYLKRMSAKVYEDYCSSWVYNNSEKPKIWLKPNAPNNLNQYGEVGFVNGISNKDFKNRKETDPIIILGEYGF